MGWQLPGVVTEQLLYKPLVIAAPEVSASHCSRKAWGGHCSHSCISLHQQIMESLRAGLWCSRLYEEYEGNYITWIKLIHETALLDMEHISNPNTWEVETGWSRAPVYQVPGQPGLYEILSRWIKTYYQQNCLRRESILLSMWCNYEGPTTGHIKYGSHLSERSSSATFPNMRPSSLD